MCFALERLAPIAFAALTLLPLVAFGQQANDPDYHGSSFNEVLGVVEDKNFTPQNSNERDEAEVYRSGDLPEYPVNFLSLGGAILNPLFSRSKKTLSERTDYYDRLPKLVHANGICIAGRWTIDKETSHTGYFKKGATGLFIGRISVALEDTTNDSKRGFGFAGKIFPTTDADATVATTNFFTVDVLSGSRAPRFLEVGLTNEPPLTPSFDIAGQLAKIIPAFLSADSSPTFRPITQIARIQAGASVRSPIWIRLRASRQTKKNDESDFRTEVSQAFHDNHGLVFTIEVSETTKDRQATSGWQPIGTIKINRVIESYGCDRRLHFGHPKDDKSNKSKS